MADWTRYIFHYITFNFNLHAICYVPTLIIVVKNELELKGNYRNMPNNKKKFYE